MSRSQSFAVLVLAIVLAAVISACAPAMAPTPMASNSATAAPTAAVAPSTVTSVSPDQTTTTTAYPLSLKDDLGRQVTVEQRPARVVSLSPSNTEILFAIGAGPQVVGVTKYCNYPPEAAQEREIVGGFSADSLSVEKILALEPDIVFSAGGIQKPIIEALEAAQVTVFALEPENFAELYIDIMAVGDITGHEQEAEQVVADMQARVEELAAVVAGIPQDQRVKVFYEVWDEPLMTAGPRTFIGQVIEIAGGINIFADLEEEYPTVSAEAVVERNPGVILGPSSHAEGMTAEKIAARPGWQEVKAVQDGRVIIIDGDIISRAGPRLVAALEEVARALYPHWFQ
ncbi:MAG: ABC transporter substrate-binding protein [Anaerolineae bacterium]